MILVRREGIKYKEFAKSIELVVKPFSNKYIGNSLFKLASSSKEYEDLCVNYDSFSSSLYRVQSINEKGVNLQRGDVINCNTLLKLKLKYEDVHIISDMDYHCIEHFSRSTEDFEKRCTSFYISRILELIDTVNDNQIRIFIDTDNSILSRTPLFRNNDKIINDFVSSNSSIIYALLLAYKDDIKNINSGFSDGDLELFIGGIVHRASLRMIEELQCRVANKIMEFGEIGYNDKIVNLLIDFMINSQEMIYSILPYNVLMKNTKKYLASLGFSIDNNNYVLYNNRVCDILNVDNVKYLLRILAICKSIPDVIKEFGVSLADNNDYSLKTVCTLYDNIVAGKSVINDKME